MCFIVVINAAVTLISVTKLNLQKWGQLPKSLKLCMVLTSRHFFRDSEIIKEVTVTLNENLLSFPVLFKRNVTL